MFILQMRVGSDCVLILWPRFHYPCFGIIDQKAQEFPVFYHLFCYFAAFVKDYDQSQPRYSKSSSRLQIRTWQYALTAHSSCIRQHTVCCLTPILSQKRNMQIFKGKCLFLNTKLVSFNSLVWLFQHNQRNKRRAAYC